MIEEPIAEHLIYHIWNDGYYFKDNLRTKDGRQIEVIFPGEWNIDAGVDFRNASIKIDGKVYEGDVEVHVKSSDWRIHHHDRNPKYNNTILQVALLDKGISLLTKKQNGDHIPTLILYNYLDRPIGRLWKVIEYSKANYPCLEKIAKIKPDVLSAIIDKASMERLNAKSESLKKSISLKGENQALYEGIMDALGYSKNREQFCRLSQKIPIEFLMGHSSEEIEAILFGVSGLLPPKAIDKETKAYIKRLFSIWDNFSSEFHNQIMPAHEWNFFRLRPENFPTKRFSAISHIIANCQKNLMSAFLLCIADNQPINQIRINFQKILMPYGSGYWADHYDFGYKSKRKSKYLIGKNRANDIIINVILPAVMAYAKNMQDHIILEKTMQLYSNYPLLQDNTITRFFTERVFGNRYSSPKIINSARHQQGLIHIYKSYCSIKDCLNCPFTDE